MKKNDSLTNIVRTALFFLVLLASMAFGGTPLLLAAGSNSSTNTSATEAHVVRLTNPLGPGTQNIPALIKNIVSTILEVIGAIALLMFVYGGLLWLTSGGVADKVKKGRDVMIWAAIGLFIVFSSAALVRFVFGAFSKGF